MNRRTEMALASARRAGKVAHEAAARAGAASPAMEAAYAAIDRGCGRSAQIGMFKDHVDRLMQLGAGHPEVYLRYRRIAERYAGGATIETAIEIVAREFRAETARRALMRPYGGAGPRLGLELLRELNLILRTLRRHAPAAYQAARETVLGVTHMQAAE